MLSEIINLVEAHGALGLACVVIAGLAWAVVHLYRAQQEATREHIATMLQMVERQLTTEKQLSDAINAALRLRGAP